MSLSAKSENWWSLKSQPGANMAARKEAIARYRSPHTIADEIYRILVWGIQPLLMVFCIALSYSSYSAFFEHNFSPMVATGGAIILSLVIELGKIKIGGYVFQTPFLQGVKRLMRSFPDFAVWAGALLITLATFTMSVINSTRGAHLLSMKVGFEKNEMAFSANTADVDAQIAQANDRIKTNGGIKWKNTVTYQAQKAIERDTRTIENLQRQREKIISDQRTDFERKRSQSDANTATGADILMASGGWVEALQGLCLFLIAACMAVIDGVREREISENLNQTNPLQEWEKPKQNGSPISNEAPATRTIGFRWAGYGQTPVEAVTQHKPPVSQPPHQNPIVIGSDQILLNLRTKLMADIPNLIAQNGKPSTVSTRINRAFDECYQAICNPDFSPTMENGAKVYSYLTNEAIPTLNRVGWPYLEHEFFIQKLLEVIPRNQVPVS